MSTTHTLAALRRAIAAIENRHAPLADRAAVLPFGIAPLDAVLGGGLPAAALHEIAAAREAEIAAAAAFALGLARRGDGNAGAVLWLTEEMAVRESGSLYGPGLDELGLAPERVVTVTAAQARDLPWAMEEALRCRAVAAVIGEFRSARGLDDVAVRRIALAASEQGGLALLLRSAPVDHPVAAATRWIVGAAPSAPGRHGLGPPAIRAQLVRNRHGGLGSWMLEWDSVARRFQLASTHPQPVAAAAGDRPHRTAAA